MTGPDAALAELILGTEPDSVPRARRFARSVVAPEAEELADDAELVVAELVTNAVLHGEPPVVVRVGASPGCARIEVEDTGRALPMRVLQRTDAMTGRGLSLVSALSAGWGVEPRQQGKAVWSELRAKTGTSMTRPDATLDRDAILAAWPDEDDLGAVRHTVRLGAVPTALLLEAKAHIDNVVREMSLLQRGSLSNDRPLPPSVLQLVDTVTVDFAEARTEIKRQALAAADRGESITNLELHLTAEAAEAGERYLAALDEADRYARSARLLTLAAPTSHRVFRGWYVRSIIEGLRALTRGEQTVEPEPFAVVLADEVDRVSRDEGLAVRLDVLQKVNTRLAASTTAEEMAAVVVEEGARPPGIESARVFLATGHGTLRSVAWHGARGQTPDPYDEFSVDADLPGAEVARTRVPIFMKSLREIYDRFPELEGYYPEERCVHIFPVAVENRTLGLLAMTFLGSPVAQDHELQFVGALSAALAQGVARLQ